MDPLMDVSALIAQNKSFKKDLNTIKSGLSGGKALRPNKSARRGGKSSWKNHYGTDKDFSMKEDFLTWLHRKPNNTSTPETINGIDWHFFPGCNRKGNHVISECRKSTAIAQGKKNKKSAAANIARVKILPVESSADDHSVSSEGSF